MRIVIKLTELGEIKRVFCDAPVRVFVLDENCQSEPLYEMSEGIGKITGVQHVAREMGNKLAADYDSTGPYKKPSPIIEEAK